MNIDIAHKHAGHLIVIQGKPFKANSAGMWNLTEVWQLLKLPKGKQPGRWRGKEKDRLAQSQNLDVRNLGAFGHQVTATKRATIEYAGWVSPEFKDLVYDAFEAVLEMPEIAILVAEKMADLGRINSAEILRRIVENDKEAQRNAYKLVIRRRLTPQEDEIKKLCRRARYFESKQRGCL
ncbi:hypothetical protein [Pseudomonas sp. HY7a-MNA-CIBAN-0227]|uniref:hypothetical protein n=1 Tax=Pseudomonas sp. HY7a-MNA-CIBAN-0227 TaxID=3140474 RepID=UPI00331998A0